MSGKDNKMNMEKVTGITFFSCIFGLKFWRGGHIVGVVVLHLGSKDGGWGGDGMDKLYSPLPFVHVCSPVQYTYLVLWLIREKTT